MSEYEAMRQIYTNLRLRGGQGELHAHYFPRMTRTEYLSALARLRANGAIVLVGPCTYELGPKMGAML